MAVRSRIAMWFVTQFLSHEWYTIFGDGLMGDTENQFAFGVS